VERQLSTSIPVVASMTFTRDDRTLLGDDPVKVANTLFQDGVDLIGVNCSGGPSQLLRILKVIDRRSQKGVTAVMPMPAGRKRVGGRSCTRPGRSILGNMAGILDGRRSLVAASADDPHSILPAMRMAIDTAPVEKLLNGVTVSVSEREEVCLLLEILPPDASSLQESLW